MIVDIDIKNQEEKRYQIFIEELSEIRWEGKVAVVTNPRVAGLHLGYLLDHIKAKELYVITLPDGEQYKNFDNLNFLLERLFDHRLDRKSLLVAFGGGVIGDMTGFAASIYQRGINFVQVPTTLLSQVDASVGGKTGINNRYGKNLVGTFCQPLAVYIDTRFLSTLPPREFSAGVAEIVKMAVLFDSTFFEWLEDANLRQDDSLKYAIRRSIELKAGVVAADEKEAGIRAALNYGHTFGHVIEHETDFSHYLHGEAVAMGIVMANALACELKTLSQEEADRIEALLRKYELPTRYEIRDVEQFYDHFFLDKKSKDDKITFILPNGIGGVLMRSDIPASTVKAVLEAFKARG